MHLIRQMNIHDVPDVLAIESCAFVHPWTQENFIYELNDNEFSYLYVAIKDNEIIGYLVHWITFNSATIVKIAVQEKHRCQGFGKALLETMIDDCLANEVETITLEVRASNESAIAFYQKNNFSFVTIKKHYYANGEDAQYMMRTLI